MSKLASAAPIKRLTADKEAAERELRQQIQILEHVKDAVVSTNLAGVIRSWNRGAQLLYGYTSQQAVGRHISSILTDTDGAFSFDAKFVTQLVNDEDYKREIVFRRKSGLSISCQASFFPVYDETGAPLWIVMYAWSNFIEREALRQQQLAATVFKTSADGMFVTDAQANIDAVNPAFEKLTGYRQEEVLGKNPRFFSSGQHSAEFYSSMWESIQGTGHWRGDIWNRRKNGEIYVQRLTISAMTEENGTVSKYVAVFSDVTEEKRQAEEAEFRANHDALTQLPNRVLLVDRLSQSLRQMAREDTRLAVLFLDLDEFKQVNDLHGHFIGDCLLQEAARRLVRELRKSDTVARLGGDEFVVVSQGANTVGSYQLIAKKLIVALSRPYHFGGLELNVTCSVGIALFPDHGGDFDALIQKADQAMYAAKRAGKNNFHLYDHDETSVDA
ncbi:MAG: diguanylate cyclase [Rhodospirillales bacterium]|nr:diguanylate cyclase [Rhodospirillales bacterium]